MQSPFESSVSFSLRGPDAEMLDPISTHTTEIAPAEACCVVSSRDSAHQEFDFVNDTGAAHMFMYQANLEGIQQACGRDAASSRVC